MELCFSKFSFERKIFFPQYLHFPFFDGIEGILFMAFGFIVLVVHV